MKIHDFFWENPSLDAYRKTVQKGEYLFRQGFPASSFLIITHGMVELVSQKKEQLCVVNYLGAGNMLGEQALVENKVYARVYGARALGAVTYLEFDQAAIQKLHVSEPKLLIDILEATLRISTERLNRMNRLVSNLRSAHPTERFLHLLLYFSVHHGQPVPEGKMVVLNFETVNYYLDITSYQMEELINDLVVRNVLLKKAETVFVVRNEKNLQDMIPKLKEEITPLTFI